VRSCVLARAVTSVVARDRSLAAVSGATGGVEDGDEEGEDEREEEGLIFECCSVAKRGREILGRPSPQYGRWMCTSLFEERMTA
jgi:hypothetical protein